MKIENFKLKIIPVLAPLSIILFAMELRLVPHPANVAPITAMALFGGFYLSKKYALVVPFVAMVLSDIFLGFHNTQLFVYGSFLLIGLLGIRLRNHKRLGIVVLASLVSSLVFFLITNFGVWLTGTMYSKDLAGLLQSYEYGLPFFRNTIFGDLLYTGLFFGSYEFALRMQRNFLLTRR